MYNTFTNNFFKAKTVSEDCPHLKEAFQQASYEILQYLAEEDKLNLKLTNKFFLDLVDCQLLLSEGIKSLVPSFLNSLMLDMSTTTIDTQVSSNGFEKKSKFKEKFNFNKSMNYYKGTEIYNKRIQSARKKTNDNSNNN
jgi:hypothetical protein